MVKDKATSELVDSSEGLLHKEDVSLSSNIEEDENSEAGINETQFKLWESGDAVGQLTRVNAMSK
ncbi:hypothetical protein J1N35_000559, partial [Gossypium stocksii]